jgi:hypothetical protein
VPGEPITDNQVQDHVYSTWDVINAKTTKIRVAVSRDRGQSFSQARPCPPDVIGGRAFTLPLCQMEALVYGAVVVLEMSLLPKFAGQSASGHGAGNTL